MMSWPRSPSTSDSMVSAATTPSRPGATISGVACFMAPLCLGSTGRSHNVDSTIDMSPRRTAPPDSMRRGADHEHLIVMPPRPLRSILAGALILATAVPAFADRDERRERRHERREDRKEDRREDRKEDRREDRK